MTKILAHRGSSAYRPENTMEAFELAIKQGADGIELDVHLSKDGHIIVFHDSTLERVSDGTGPVYSRSLEELKNIKVGGCRIPSLAEVYDLLSGSDLIVNVELKTSEIPYPDLPKKLLALEQEFNMKEQLLYSSFNHSILKELQSPNTRIAPLYNHDLAEPWLYAKQLGAYAIHPSWHVLAADLQIVEKCHAEGILVHTWTVDDPQQMCAVYENRIDMIITNKPDLAIILRG